MSEDEYYPTDFLKNQRDLFKNLTFKFEGFSTQTEKAFERLVKDLGGKISDEAKYMLCEIASLKTDQIKEQNDLYDISYILDSIHQEKLQNIQNYRYASETSHQCQNHNALCTVAKFAIKTNYYYRVHYNPLLCKFCRKASDYSSGVLKIKNINTIIKTEITDKNNTTSTSQSSIDIVPNIKMESPKSVKKFKKDDVIIFDNEDLEDVEVLEVLEETNSKVNNKQSNSEWIGAKKRRKNSDTDNDDTDNDNDGSMENDDEEKYDNFNEWWKSIKVSKDQACGIQSCTFEPLPHAKHAIKSRVFSLVEKRILLKFLILNNNIEQAKRTKIYEKMHDQGYLKHRSIESLRNCFRRTILPHIYKFRLPEDILKRFMYLNGAQLEKNKKPFIK